MFYEMKFMNPGLITTIKKGISFDIEIINKRLESPPPFWKKEVVRVEGKEVRYGTFIQYPEEITSPKYGLVFAKKDKK